MKKQTNPDIKAHLIRSTFYVLLLLAVCVIPFALAQRNQRSIGNRTINVARPSLKQQTQALKKSPAPPQGTCPFPWSFVASMPLDLYGAGGASDGTFYYSAGGYSFSTSTTLDVVYRYNPGTDTWDTMASMPQAAIMPTAVYYPPTNKIYVFGGEDADSGTNYDITRIFDIASGTWSTGTPMPGVISFAAGGYIPGTGLIYIVSGYNTGFVDSAQPNTWAYDPVADSWTDLTGTIPFPHPAGGMAFGVINNKLYIAGGRDAANVNINLNWEFDPTVPAYTQKADMPGSQPNVRGSAVAVDALFAFGGGNPFLAPESVPTRAASAAGEAPGSGKTARDSANVARDSAKTAPVRNFDPVATKRQPLLPTTSGRTDVYVPATDTWTRSANLNIGRSFPSGAFISASDEIICSGGFDGGFTQASAEVLTPCIPPPPTPCPPTPTPTPPCGLTIGDGLTIGFGPSGYQQIASNIVNYTFSSSVNAPGEFAIFETHDPWGYTVIKDAIIAAGHTYTVFTPADLAGFDFSQYRVVILNWDDTLVTAFGGSAACGGGGYASALPALEAYAAAGGVVWVQGAIQGSFGDCFPLPFGGQACFDLSLEDPITDECSPEVIGVSNPIEGFYASHTSDTGLPAAAHVVVINGGDSNPVLYHLACATPQPTPTPTPVLGCNTGLIHNGGFETGNLSPSWVIDSNAPSPVVTSIWSHSGSHSAVAGGDLPLAVCGFGTEALGDSSFYQQFGPVPPGAVLSFWHWDCTTDSITFDWQDAYITDTSGNILQTIYHQCANCQSWVQQTVDLSPWVGQTIGVKFLVHQDGFGDLTVMFVDDVGVFLTGPCAPTATPTPRATPRPRSSPTPPPRP
jgi:Galactose oxidase, central domain/Kelch motif